MNDTISREAVADAINGIECTRHTTWYEFYQKVMTAVEKLQPAEPNRGKWIHLDRATFAIKQLPPIQPDIVRCKDCKYAEYIDDVKTFWCTECGQGRTVAPNDYCSYAERREETT